MQSNKNWTRKDHLLSLPQEPCSFCPMRIRNKELTKVPVLSNLHLRFSFSIMERLMLTNFKKKKQVSLPMNGKDNSNCKFCLMTKLKGISNSIKSSEF